MRLRPLFALIAATGASLAVLVAGTGTAGAHGDEGEMTLTRFVQVGPVTVEVEVGIVYGGDGHLAEDAAVSATLAGPDGATVGPVELIRTGENSSLYAASIDVTAPGDWEVAVTSTEPEAEATGTVTVAEQEPASTSSTTAPPAVDESGATATGEGGGTEEATGGSAEAAADGAEGADDSGPNLVLVTVASLALAAIVIGGAVLVARRRAAADNQP
jgi:hypothetical protein